MKPTVSAIVCTYNRAESLRETLRALLAQTLPTGVTLEILIVDNNSTDHTKRVVEEMAASSAWPIRYTRETRQGLSHARNRGIQDAQGEWVAFTDDDAVPEPSWIYALWQAQQQHRADCVGGRIQLLWLTPPPMWLMHETTRQELWGVLGHLDRGPSPILASTMEEAFLYGGNLAIRKMVFEELGMFRTDLGLQGPGSQRQLTGEDTEMTRRLFRAGKRVVYTPDAIVYHKVPRERMSQAYFRRWKFDAGRSLARASTVPSHGVPAWAIRECLASGAAWARACGSLDVSRRAKEMMFWLRCGRVVGMLERR